MLKGGGVVKPCLKAEIENYPFWPQPKSLQSSLHLFPLSAFPLNKEQQFRTMWLPALKE